MVKDEVIRGVIHPRHETCGVADDDGAVAPGEDGREEAGDFDVLKPGEAVRDRDRVRRDEGGGFVEGGAGVEKISDGFGFIWRRHGVAKFLHPGGNPFSYPHTYTKLEPKHAETSSLKQLRKSAVIENVLACGGILYFP